MSESGVQILLNRTRDLGTVELLETIGKKLRHEWQLIALDPHLWLLVAFRDSGIVDHPMGENAGGTEGKAKMLWHRRKHEVLGIGGSPAEAARDILRGGNGARLQAFQTMDGVKRLHLQFRNIDTREIVEPAGLLLLPSFAKS